MIVALALPAWADPVALRLPERGPAVAVGLRDVSIGVPIGELDVALELRTDLGAAGASAGVRGRPWGNLRGWRIDVGGAVGVLVPLVEPSFVWTVTPWTALGVVGRRGYAEVVLAAPLASSLGTGFRVPLQPELQAGAAFGRWMVGPRVALTAVWTPGLDVSTAPEGGITLAYRTDPPHRR